MSDSCCASSSESARDARCPVSGYPGKKVGWLTVAALSAGAVPPRQKYWLCRDPSCDLVYFTSGGTVLESRDLQVVPGFKDGSDGLVCYCFQHRRSDILAAEGENTIFEAIKVQVKAGNCACEVRNPMGKCCLGEVRQTSAELMEEPKKGLASRQSGRMNRRRGRD